VVLVVLTVLVASDRYPPLPGDQTVTTALTSWAETIGLGASFWSVVTWFGAGPLLSVVGVAGAAILAWRRRRRDAAALLVAMATVFSCWALLRISVARPRPDGGLVPTDTAIGFPSGHATNAAALATLTILLIAPHLPGRSRGLLIATVVVFAAAIGVSRVTLAVHYPSDVLAGWALAGTLVSLTITATHAVERRIRRPPRTPRPSTCSYRTRPPRRRQRGAGRGRTDSPSNPGGPTVTSVAVATVGSRSAATRPRLWAIPPTAPERLASTITQPLPHVRMRTPHRTLPITARGPRPPAEDLSQ